MTIAQHHGLPTRLLDWAESSLVGLFFAVTSARGKDDPEEPAVWVLKPDAINEILPQQIGGKIPVIVGHSQDRKLVDREWGLLTGQSPAAHPIAVRTVAISERVSAQHGVFTLFGTHRDSLENLTGDTSMLRCLDVDPDAVERIQDELRQAGVTAASVFPDLDGCAGHSSSCGSCGRGPIKQRGRNRRRRWRPPRNCLTAVPMTHER